MSEKKSLIKSKKDREESLYVKMLVTGLSGVGKTSRITDLTEKGLKVLVVDGEAGLLSVKKSDFDSIHVREVAAEVGTTAWQLIRHIAVLLTGANPNSAPNTPYSAAHYAAASNLFGANAFDEYDAIFFDSITEFARDAKSWATQQDSVLTKQGAIDMRAVYGLIGDEMVGFMRQVQHANCDVVCVGGLREKISEDGVPSYSLLLEGSKSSAELPYIFDEVLTLIANPDDLEKRQFVTCASNSHGYPAKDRSGELSPIENANLYEVINKIKGKE